MHPCSAKAQCHPLGFGAPPKPPGPYLAAVAALVEAASQALNLVGVLVLVRDNGALAGAAHRGVFPDGSKRKRREPCGVTGTSQTQLPVWETLPHCQPVEVGHAVHITLLVHGKALGADGPATGSTGKAAGVVALAQGTDDVLRDQPLALGTFLQRSLEFREHMP